MIYIILLLNFYIYHNFRKNTRWVTEVTEVTRVLNELLTQEAECFRLPRLPRLPPAFFYRKNGFNNI